MALTTSGKWTKEKGVEGFPVPVRDYFSGELTVSATYGDDIEFGFFSGEILLENTGAGVLVYQWLNRKDEAVDSGVVDPNSKITWRNANKNGLRLRYEGATVTTARVTAVA